MCAPCSASVLRAFSLCTSRSFSSTLCATSCSSAWSDSGSPAAAAAGTGTMPGGTDAPGRRAAATVAATERAAAAALLRPAAASAARPPGVGRPLRTSGRVARLAGRFSPGSTGMTSTSSTTSVSSSGRWNCTLYLEPLMVRMEPSCSCRVCGWRATTSCPTRSGLASSGGTSCPTPISSYRLRTCSLYASSLVRSSRRKVSEKRRGRPNAPRSSAHSPRVSLPMPPSPTDAMSSMSSLRMYQGRSTAG
mmetsp:Transcript_12552/g.30798  ORF Transcript_12552/g.30798 Transcript_12552/m.30798 type:complete len:249 (-) Transcript_12552:674-1420(-)